MKEIKNDERLNMLNHSCAHLLAHAVKHIYPQAKFWVGPVIDEGFYYDIDLGDISLTEEDLPKIEREMKKGNIKDKVIVQAGQTKYESKNMEIFDFIEMNKFNCLLKEADLVITHGGVGTILSAIRLNKKVIAVPRLKKYMEHENDHQIQIVKEFDKLGYIKACLNLKKLDKILEEIKDFKPKKYKSNNNRMIKIIENYIDNI